MERPVASSLPSYSGGTSSALAQCSPSLMIWSSLSSLTNPPRSRPASSGHHDRGHWYSLPVNPGEQAPPLVSRELRKGTSIRFPGSTPQSYRPRITIASTGNLVSVRFFLDPVNAVEPWANRYPASTNIAARDIRVSPKVRRPPQGPSVVRPPYIQHSRGGRR